MEHRHHRSSLVIKDLIPREMDFALRAYEAVWADQNLSVVNDVPFLFTEPYRQNEVELGGQSAKTLSARSFRNRFRAVPGIRIAMTMHDQLRKEHQLCSCLLGSRGPSFDRIQVLVRLSQQAVQANGCDSQLLHIAPS